MAELIIQRLEPTLALAVVTLLIAGALVLTTIGTHTGLIHLLVGYVLFGVGMEGATSGPGAGGCAI